MAAERTYRLRAKRYIEQRHEMWENADKPRHRWQGFLSYMFPLNRRASHGIAWQLCRRFTDWVAKGARCELGSRVTYQRPTLGVFEPLEDRRLLTDGVIAGMLWDDVDGDSDRDAGEPVLAGWNVYLDRNNDGDRDPGERFETTAADGSYRITGLIEGTYVVRCELPDEWGPTHPSGLCVEDIYRLNYHAGDDQWSHDIGMDDVGNLTAAWISHYQNPPGTEFSGWGRAFYADCSPQNNEFMYSTTVTHPAAGWPGPSVARDADGDSVVAYASSGIIYARMYTAGGVAKGNAFQVSTAGNASYPTVSMDPEGDFVVTWQALTDIYCQRYRADGTAEGPIFRANSETTGSQTEPYVASDAAGNFIVGWVSERQDGPRYDIRARIFEPFGTAITDELHVNTVATLDSHYGGRRGPVISTDAAGNFIVAWNNLERSNNDWTVYARKYQNDGTPVETEFLVASGTATAYHPRYGYNANHSVAMDSEGNFVITWAPEGETHWDNEGVRARLYPADWDQGDPAPPDFAVHEDTTGSQRRPRVEMDGAGNFVISWESDELGSWDNFARRFTLFPAHTVVLHDSSEIVENQDFANQRLPDFGDAPDPYPTLLGDNGARHRTYGPTLGAQRDTESEGQPTATADGDDTTGTPDDEDGVTFGTIRAGQLDAGVTVNVQNAPGGAKLDAWIDFNQDGSWDAAGEKVFHDETVVEGNNDLEFFVPADAHIGSTFARFRISTAGGLALRGLAADGEVEDYQITITAPAGTGQFVDSGQRLGSAASKKVALGDLDGNGTLDAFVVNVNEPNKVWLNDGNGIFQDSGQTLGTAASHNLALGDLDGDGDLDAYVANDGPNEVWFNNGGGLFTHRSQNLGSWASRSVGLGDLDHDGDLDAFVANDNQGNRVWWNDGAGNFSDSGQSLGGLPSFDMALGNLDPVVPPNGDGDLDAFVANSNYRNKVWLNDGTGYYIDSGEDLGGLTSHSVALADYDDDDDLDAFIANDNYRNKVWLNDGTAHFVDSGEDLGGTTSQDVAAGDLDGDGDLDAFVVNYNDTHRLWVNDGNAHFTDSGQVFDPSAHGQGVALGDLDNDGDLDVFVVNWQQPNRVWLNSSPTAEIRGVKWNDLDGDGEKGPGEPPLEGWRIYVDENLNGQWDDHGVTWEPFDISDTNGEYQLTGLPPGEHVVREEVKEGWHQTAIGSDELVVNTYTSSDQALPSLAMDASGNHVITWDSQYEDGDIYGVYGQRFDADGVAQGSPFRVNTTTANNQGKQSVAMTPTGEFVVVWSSWWQVTWGHGVDNYFQRYDTNGVPVGGETLVNQYTANEQWLPDVAIRSDGSFVVVWGSEGQDGSGSGVYGRHFDANGIPQGNEFRINTYTAGDQHDPSIAMDANGNYVVAWSSYGQDGDDYGVFGRRFATDGTPFDDEEFQVNTYTAGLQGGTNPHDRPQHVAIGPGGEFIIVWASEQRDGDGLGVFARRFAPDGTPVDDQEFQVNSYTVGDQAYPFAAIHSDGSFIIAWDSMGQDGSERGVYAQTYHANGVRAGREFRLNDYTSDYQGGPVISMLSEGGFIAAWTSDGQDGDRTGIVKRSFADHYRVAVGAGEVATDIDFGNQFIHAELHGRVWHDLNENDIQDVADVGVAEIVVNLLDDSGHTQASTVSAADGSYEFMGLTPGDYVVEFVPPVGFVFVRQDQGSDDELDSDANVSTGRTETVALNPGELNRSVDAGMLRPAGFVYWADVDNRVVQYAGLEIPAGETPDNRTDIIPITSTANTKNELAIDVVHNKVYWTEAGRGDVVRANLDGSDAEIVVDLDWSAYAANGIDLDVEEDSVTVYWSTYGAPSNSSYVFRAQLDETSVLPLTQGDVEQLLVRGVSRSEGLEVALDVAAGKLYWSDPYYNYTPSEGIFRANLDGSSPERTVSWDFPEGIVLDVANGKIYWTDFHQGQIRRADLDGSNSELLLEPGPANAIALDLWRGKMYWTESTNYELGAGKIRRANLDGSELEDLITSGLGRVLGIVLAPGTSAASVSNFVWHDLDGNGIQDLGEPPLTGVTVTLHNQSTGEDFTATTNADGISFFGLEPGDYIAHFTAPPQFGFSPRNQGSDDALDSDPDPTTGQAAAFTLSSGEHNTNIDAGLTAVPQPLIEVTDSYDDPNDYSIEFGDVDSDGTGGATATAEVYVRNVASVMFPEPLIIDRNGISLANGIHYEILTIVSDVSGPIDIGSLNDEDRTVRPNGAETWTVTIQFDPLAIGQITDTLSILSNDPDEAQVDVSLTGNGVATNLDFGDAPAPYPTLFHDDGARHEATGPRLGAGRDTERVGQPSATADGDDTTGIPDDEDGVTFTTPLVPGDAASIDVVASAAGRLDAWIDFGDDGGWLDAGDRIFTNQPLVAGTNTLFFTVPVSATLTGQTYARFRFSSVGNLAPTGPADDGEVEDYQVAVDAPPVADADGPYEADLGGGVTFDGTGSHDLDDGIASYRWDIADGTYVLAGPTPGLTPAEVDAIGVGTYPVVLTVTDSYGAADTDTSTLSVYDNRPAASFTANPNPAACNQDITFDGSGSSHGRPDRSIVSYEWDFDYDGAAFGVDTTGVIVTHIYSQFGSYTAALRVTDDNFPAKSDIVAKTVEVNQGNRAPVADAHPDPDPDSCYLVVVGQDVTLDGSGSSDPDASCGDDIASYSWDIAGGMYIKTGENPILPVGEVEALGPGTHQIVLTVWDSFGLSDDDTTELEVLPNTDYGDAADPRYSTAGNYPTLADNNGAVHTIVPGFHLGETVDGEIDGQPDVYASGDDDHGDADEDGMTWGGKLEVGKTVPLTVNVTDTIGGGRLDAWIDFNRDGDWNDAGEKFIANQPVVDGPNNFSVTVPTGLRPGLTTTRFRLSTEGNLPPDGAAADGEVEDHAVEIWGQPLIGVFRLRVFFIDLNGNGKWDTKGGGDVVWAFGGIGDLPIVGDWDGDGRDEIGVYRRRNSKFYVDLNGSGFWEGPLGGDIAYQFGVKNLDLPVSGDWNGDGIDDLGTYRPTNRKFYLDLDGDHRWSGADVDGVYPFDPFRAPPPPIGCDPNDDDALTPVIGDWNNDGKDELGMHCGKEFRLDANGNRAWDGPDGGDVACVFVDGVPVAGDWNADGKDQIGVRAGALFKLDWNDNCRWDGQNGGDAVLNMGGLSTDLPLVGRWCAPASPLLAAPGSGGRGSGPADDAPHVETLTFDVLAPVVERAVDLFSAAPLSAAQRQALGQLEVRIANLPGAMLGQAFGSIITLDVDAAGWGWDESRERRAESGEPEPLLADRMDLLSALMHELGHVLGSDDDYLDPDSDDLMNGWLEAGVRRDLTADHLDRIFAEEDWFVVF